MTDAIVTQANATYRDYIVDGVPSSLPHNPSKSDIRSLWLTLAGILDGLSGAATGGSYVGFTTLALLNADLAYPANTVGEVIADSTPANNGIYLKSGASGSGSWTQVSTLTLAGLNAAISAETTRAEAAEATLTASAAAASAAAASAVAAAAPAQALLTDISAFDDTVPERFSDRHVPKYLYNLGTSGAVQSGYYGVASETRSNVLYVIPCMGQSNALGAVDTGSLVAGSPISGNQGRALMPSPTCRLLPSYGYRVQSLAPLVEAVASGSVGETMGSGLVNHLLSYLDAAVSGNKPPICWFVSAIGNTYLWELKRGSPVYMCALWAIEDIVRLARADGMRVVVPAFVWYQGENDVYGTQQEAYTAGLLQYRRQFEDDVVAITGQTERVTMFVPQIARVSSAETFQQIHAAELEAAAIDPFIRIPGPTYFAPASSVAANYPHKSNVGQNRIGQMVGRAIFAEMCGNGWRPTMAIKVYFVSSTVIRVQCHVPVAPLVIDTTGDVNPSGLPTGNYNGFDVQDSTGAYLTISGIAVSNPQYTVSGTGIDITLSSAPTNFPLLVSYAMRRNSTSDSTTFDGPVTGARGCIHDSAADASIYDSHLSYNWLCHFQTFLR